MTNTSFAQQTENSLPSCLLALCKSEAFTLAEVLITLGIIGVVAAMVIPSLLSNVNERVNSNRQANIAYKVTQATNKMQALGLLNGSYRTTDEFVDELQKHLKVAKRCDASHIADCWPTDKVTTTDGKEYYVRNAEKGSDLRILSNTTDNVGLVLADGAALILTYNQDSFPIDDTSSIVASKKSLPVGNGKSEDFAYTTNTTASIDFVMDVNGAKGPNSEPRNGKYYDIRSFKVARFRVCTEKVPGVGCVLDIGTSYDCLSKGSDEQKKWDSDLYYELNTSCWGGAKKACSDIGMSLANTGTLKTLYEKRSQYSDLPKSGAFWSSSAYVASVSPFFDFSDYRNGETLYDRKNMHYRAMCVGD